MRNRRKVLLLSAGVIAGAAVAVLVWRPWSGGRTGHGGSAVSQTQPAAPDLIAASNRGVGLVGQFDYEKAAAVFSELSTKRPDWVDARVNLAIATLNRQREGDEEAALQILAKVLAEDPKNLRAHYCSGLLLLRRGKLDEARAHLTAVAEADPSDAHAAYYTGECFFQEGEYAQSLAWHERAAKADPSLRSAYYGAAQALRQLGKLEEFKQKLAEFERLKDNPRAQLAEYKYTRMGPKAEAIAGLPPGVQQPPAPAVPQGPVFSPPTPLAITGAEGIAWGAADPALGPPGVTACDIDGDGSLDLFVAGGVTLDGRRGNAVLLGRGNGFQLDAQHPLARVGDVTAALWGDVDNDGLTDVYLCRRGPNQLWRQTAKGQWSDITSQAKADGGDYHTTDGALFDADHDGDLDLFLVNRNGTNELLNNNNDGTFRPIAKDRGIAGDGRPSVGLVVADFDTDRDADLMVMHDSPPHEMYLNDRLWNYRPAAGAEALLGAEIDAVVAADADSDGRVEIYTVASGALSRWSRDSSGTWQRAAVGPALSATVKGKARLAVADVIGSGQVELLASDGAGWKTVGLASAGQGDLAARGVPVEAWSVVTLDAGLGPAVVGVRANQSPVLWSPGGGRYPFAAVQFSGRTNAGESMRSNASGIGTKAAARVGARWTALHTWRSESGPGQSLQPAALGLGGQKAIDFLKIEWSDGVSQTELSLEPGRLHRVAETQRQLSSCPVLFVWDGSRYVFVTDLLGVGGIGYAVAPGEYAPPRPFENVLLPEGLPRGSQDRRIRLKLAEPMEEACYLDSAALVAYDLPPGWQMVLDERMGISGPAPTGEARFYRREISPVAATDGTGRYVLATLREADHVAAPVAARDARFIGRTAEQTITLTFGEALNTRAQAGEPILIADGWVEYPYSQTMFAAWQARADYRAPTLEARGADGQWHIILEQFGYPAGMPRRMSVPIPRDRLPPGTTQLRLRTNQEIYWDRLSIAWAEPCPQAKRQPLHLAGATVGFCGFPRRTTHAQQRPNYDYARRAPLWDMRHQSGWYTAFGPAEELVASADDALAIFGPGEELHLEFTGDGAVTTPPPRGWTRRFVLETVGWCKDMDLYTNTGETIDPMPVRGPMTDSQKAHRDALHRKYNTRYQSGG